MRWKKDWSSSLCPPSLYIELGRSRAQIESVTSLGFAPLNILSVLVLLSKDPKMSWAWVTRKSPQATYILVGLPWAGGYNHVTRSSARSRGFALKPRSFAAIST
jgi:hypothetical protein